MELDVKSIAIKDGNLKYGVWTQSPAELGLFLFLWLNKKVDKIKNLCYNIYIRKRKNKVFAGLTQLGECYSYKVEATGSNPVSCIRASGLAEYLD